MKILGYEYRVVQIEEGANLGASDYNTSTIKADFKAGRQVVVSTIIHEAIHAIDNSMDVGLSEHQVLLLESGIRALLVDNGVDLTPLLDGLDLPQKES